MNRFDYSAITALAMLPALWSKLAPDSERGYNVRALEAHVHNPLAATGVKAHVYHCLSRLLLEIRDCAKPQVLAIEHSTAHLCLNRMSYLIAFGLLTIIEDDTKLSRGEILTRLLGDAAFFSHRDVQLDDVGLDYPILNFNNSDFIRRALSAMTEVDLVNMSTNLSQWYVNQPCEYHL